MIANKLMKNWGGNVQFTPAKVLAPKSVDEIGKIIKEAISKKSNIRVIGARHSFSPLIETTSTILDLSNLNGLISVDSDKNTATFWSGTAIKEIGPALHQHGLALANQGDIDNQTLAGAVSTGTHGTGISFGSISSFITALEFVDGTGTLQVVDQNSPDNLLYAAQVSLGTFGVLTKITVQCVPSFILFDDRKRMEISQCLAAVPDLIKKHRHVEFFWFPYSSLVQVKALGVVEELRPRSLLKRIVDDEIIERAFYKLLCDATSVVPRFSEITSKLCGRLIPETNYSNHSYKVYPSSRAVRFTEMEYAVPLTNGVACFNEVKQMIEREKIQVFFPIEFRVAAADKAWLSPFHERDSAIISLHVYKNIDEDRYFSNAEKILKSFGGRPHWGKIHNLTGEEVKALYPRWNDFSKLRLTFDPEGLFLNQMLNKYF